MTNSTMSFFFIRFFDLFEKCDGYKSGKLKLKKPKQLQASTFDFLLSLNC